MAVRIKINELPFCEKVPSGYSEFFRKNLSRMKSKAGEILFRENQSLPGLYVLLNGSVDLIVEERNELIETLPAGSSFGETSLVLLEDATFTARAGKEGADMLFLEAAVFRDFLSNNPAFASPFFKAALGVIGERIRNANKLIEEETGKLKSEIFHMMKGNRIDERLVETQMAVNATGAQMFNKLADLLPELNNVMSNGDGSGEILEKIRREIQNVLTIDSQNFDLISQQIDVIHMYILNIQRFLQAQKLQTIHGDFSITALAQKTGTADAGEVEFF